MWNGAQYPTVSLDMMYRPIKQGEKKLLNIIKSRNEAIELMKTKRYLTLGPLHPIWAKMADILTGKNLKKKWKLKDEEMYQNIFLQALEPTMRPTEDGLLPSLHRMLKAARKHEVKFSLLDLSLELKHKLPIWYHTSLIEIKRPGFNSVWAKCQRVNHHIRTVEELRMLIASLSLKNNLAYKPHKNCKCGTCKDLREKGCKNPHKCRSAAKRLLEKLGSKWNLSTNKTPSQYFTMNKEGGTQILFNKDIQTKELLDNSFQVFDHAKEALSYTAETLTEPKYGPPNQVTAYTDGSCKKNGCTDTKAGAGVWYRESDPWNIASALPKEVSQFNNSGEIIAILLAVNNAHTKDALKIHSNSQITIDALTKSLERMEDSGWIEIENKTLLQVMASKLRAREGPLSFSKVKGHSGNIGNEGADVLAKEGVNREHTSIDCIIPMPGYYHKGAKLLKAMQALLYRGIIELKPTSQRRSTRINLDIVRWAVKEETGNMPTDERIWLSIKNKNLTKEYRAFI